ncbi:MAG TPA: beta-propeller fold lactonase family protein [Solirubrobacteraceae bacterium]|nr:beta-propeller fold lactonase family protein [Solirubrobacteraceae bacterium]
MAAGAAGAPPATAATPGALNEIQCLAEPAYGTYAACGTGAGFELARAIVISPDGRNPYAVAQGFNGPGGLTSFDRDPSTGALTQKSLANNGCIHDGPATATCASEPNGLLKGLAFLALSPDGKYLYTAASGSEAIGIFQRDLTTGVLVQTGCMKSSTSPATCATNVASISQLLAIAVSPDGKNLYATTQAPAHAVTSFSRDATTGALTFQSCLRDASGAAGCTPSTLPMQTMKWLAVSPDGGNVYVTAQASKSVDTFNRDPATGLTDGGCASTTGNGGTCITLPTVDNPFGVAVSPDGANVYVAANFSNAVVTFNRGPSGALAFAGCQVDGGAPGCGTASALTGAFAVAVSPDGASVYAASSGAKAIAVFDRASGGALTQKSMPAGCVDAAGTGCTPGQALQQPVWVTVSPDNLNLYSAAYGSAAFDVFSRNLAPACQAVSATVQAGSSVSIPLRCSDPNGDTLSLAAASAPAHGTLGAIAPDGRASYTPAASYSGPDSFTYQATDPGGVRSAPATASINVTPAPAPPPPSTITSTTPNPPPPPPSGPPPPQPGRSANLAPAGGTVLIRGPGSSRFVSLREARQVLVGTVVDTTRGRVSLCSAADRSAHSQCSDFYGGVFRFSQTQPPLTDLTLVGDLSGCHRVARRAGVHAARARRRGHTERHLWGNGHGHFRTRGNYASATVRSTIWLVQDRCDRTLVRVRRGVVGVRDQVRRRNVSLPAGHSYTALARRKRPHA